MSVKMPASPNFWRLFHVGFWSLTLSYSVLGLSKTRWQINGDYIAAPLFFVSAICLTLFYLEYRNKVKIRFGPIISLFFSILIFLGVIAAVRSVDMDEILLSMRNMWGGRFYAWTWFMPLFMMLPNEPLIIQQLLIGISRQGRLGLIIISTLWIPPIKIFTFFNLCWGCSALLIFWHHLSKGARFIAVIGALLTVFFSVLNSERNAIIGHGFLMLSASYIMAMRRYRFRGRRQIGLIFMFMCIFGVVNFTIYNQNIPLLSNQINAKIQQFKVEAFDNTRVSKSGVSLYQDFLDDLDVWDLTFGRGALGTYYSKESGGIQRQVIECGYCQVVLKGGGVMLCLMLILSLMAVWKGIFDSRNWIVKGFAFIVIGWLIEMFPYGVPAAFPRYALYWIAIGVCLNPRIRLMTDQEIDRYFLERGGSFIRR